MGMGVHKSGRGTRSDVVVLGRRGGGLMDRRAVFFLCSALICTLLTVVTPSELRWVGNVMAVAYAALAAASWLDHLSRRRSHR
jgi:hypothetical protein